LCRYCRWSPAIAVFGLHRKRSWVRWWSFQQGSIVFNVDCGQRGPQVAILVTIFATIIVTIFVTILGADIKAVFKSRELAGILATSIDGPTLPLAAAAMKSNLVFRMVPAGRRPISDSSGASK
jgi:hypothetical protein